MTKNHEAASTLVEGTQVGRGSRIEATTEAAGYTGECCVCIPCLNFVLWSFGLVRRSGEHSPRTRSNSVDTGKGSEMSIRKGESLLVFIC